MDKEKILKDLNNILLSVNKLRKILREVEVSTATLILETEKNLPRTKYMNPTDFKPIRKWQPSDCRKEVEGCFCVTGYPYRMLCSKCRDKRTLGDDKDYCICG